MFKFYILKSKLNDSYYIGSSNNLKSRIKLHNSGLVKSTKRYLPWNLVYFENSDNLKAARRREKQVKSWKKRLAVERLMKSKFNKSRIHDSSGGSGPIV